MLFSPISREATHSARSDRNRASLEDASSSGRGLRWRESQGQARMTCPPRREAGFTDGWGWEGGDRWYRCRGRTVSTSQQVQRELSSPGVHGQQAQRRAFEASDGTPQPNKQGQVTQRGSLWAEDSALASPRPNDQTTQDH